jgi:hypothetical protein
MTTRTQSFTIQAGQSGTFNALQYFTLSSASGSGLTWSEKGKNEPNPLSVRQVYGERASGEIGQIEIRNPTGADITGVYTTSDRAIAWSSDGTSSSVTITGATATIPVSAVQLPASLGQKTMVQSMAVVLASDQSAVPTNQQVVKLTPAALDNVGGILGANLLTGDATWLDVTSYMGQHVAFAIITSAGLAGGNVAFEQSIDPAFDPGAAWNSQDATAITQSMVSSQTVAASSVYRRVGIVAMPWIRLRLSSAITAGSVRAVIIFSAVPFSNIVSAINQAAGSALNAQVTGSAAHSSAASGNPARVAAKAKTTNDTTLTDNDTSDLIADAATGGLVSKPYSPSALDFNIPAAAGGIVNTTTATTIRAAAGASLRSYVTMVDISWDALTNATEYVIRDGAAGPVLYRHKIPNGIAGRHQCDFATPLRGTANTLLEHATLTASGAGGVFANVGGYTAAG